MEEGRLMELKVAAETIIGDFVSDINPIDLDTGNKIECTHGNFVIAWDKAVNRIVNLSK